MLAETPHAGDTAGKADVEFKEMVEKEEQDQLDELVLFSFTESSFPPPGEKDAEQRSFYSSLYQPFPPWGGWGERRLSQSCSL